MPAFNVQIQTTAEDGFIDNLSGSKIVYKIHPYLSIYQSSSAATDLHRTYLFFDIASVIPPGAVITAASLNLKKVSSSLTAGATSRTSFCAGCIGPTLDASDYNGVFAAALENRFDFWLGVLGLTSCPMLSSTMQACIAGYMNVEINLGGDGTELVTFDSVESVSGSKIIPYVDINYTGDPPLVPSANDWIRRARRRGRR